MEEILSEEELKRLVNKIPYGRKECNQQLRYYDQFHPLVDNFTRLATENREDDYKRINK